MTKRVKDTDEERSLDPAEVRVSDSDRFTLAGFEKAMLPALREIIQRFENREIDRQEAEERIEEARTRAKHSS